MKKLLFAVLLVLVVTVPAFAKNTINIPSAGLTQDEFKSFSEDFGMAVSYVPMSPAAPLGDKLPGFDAGVEASYVKLNETASYFQKLNSAAKALGNEFPKELVIPRVHVQVGLPIIPIDFGVSYASVPSSDIKLVGYELKYAILSGTMATPAVAIRAAYTKLSGLDELDLSTKSIDLSISKGILIFTPYAGIGEVWITSDPKNPKNVPGFTLKSEDVAQTKFFVGSKVKIFPFINLVIEGDFSNVKEYSARLNVNF